MNALAKPWGDCIADHHPNGDHRNREADQKFPGLFRPQPKCQQKETKPNRCAQQHHRACGKCDACRSQFGPLGCRGSFGSHHFAGQHRCHHECNNEQCRSDNQAALDASDELGDPRDRRTHEAKNSSHESELGVGLDEICLIAYHARDQCRFGNTLSLLQNKRRKRYGIEQHVVEVKRHQEQRQGAQQRDDLHHESAATRDPIDEWANQRRHHEEWHKGDQQEQQHPWAGGRWAHPEEDRRGECERETSISGRADRLYPRQASERGNAHPPANEFATLAWPIA